MKGRQTPSPFAASQPDVQARANPTKVIQASARNDDHLSLQVQKTTPRRTRTERSKLMLGHAQYNSVKSRESLSNLSKCKQALCFTAACNVWPCCTPLVSHNRQCSQPQPDMHRSSAPAALPHHCTLRVPIAHVGTATLQQTFLKVRRHKWQRTKARTSTLNGARDASILTDYNTSETTARRVVRRGAQNRWALRRRLRHNSQKTLPLRPG